MKKTYQLIENLGDGDTSFSTIELSEEQYELLQSILPWDITVEEFSDRKTTLEELVEKLREKAAWDNGYEVDEADLVRLT